MEKETKQKTYKKAGEKTWDDTDSKVAKALDKQSKAISALFTRGL